MHVPWEDFTEFCDTYTLGKRGSKGLEGAWNENEWIQINGTGLQAAKEALIRATDDGHSLDRTHTERQVKTNQHH